MRIVHDADELPGAARAGAAGSGAAFVRADVYLEKYIERAAPHRISDSRPIEHGHVEILGERDCSIQRRHQKLLEESPSPALRADSPRSACREALRRRYRAIGYTNAGTVEFLMDEKGELYFIEVNARIQVEHPVTEMVTGIDLVKAQIRIAAGEKLSRYSRAARCELRGHAIECRINAENPETFAPSPGRITGLNLPGGIGIRVDTHAYTGRRDSALLRFVGGQADCPRRATVRKRFSA